MCLCDQANLCELCVGVKEQVWRVSRGLRVCGNSLLSASSVDLLFCSQNAKHLLSQPACFQVMHQLSYVCVQTHRHNRSFQSINSHPLSCVWLFGGGGGSNPVTGGKTGSTPSTRCHHMYSHSHVLYRQFRITS